MDEWISWQDYCPYCAERLELLLDAGFTETDESLVYTEDCQVCCRPIVVTLSIDEEGNRYCQLKTESDS
ncbi:CPXCG motif-containing cysteine-rich protein [Endozoicomonas sp. SCSIO W0465]|uniref:CPXCG motif-containing cysteine-rich protein n=1 Tax=Endozoicomonas sp. SCSIO W0465 TaxID=2918516 RepID=UPI002075976F|nr:CPXCG motif-containing cysteine-rich protein [Endozoicomonas sp. SCSIO W0465]USE36027.1 CPXCG motif-containing cysteine-rich protein [Endozoicomonas sp. SCSIO W0465]